MEDHRRCEDGSRVDVGKGHVSNERCKGGLRHIDRHVNLELGIVKRAPVDLYGGNVRVIAIEQVNDIV